MRDLDFHLDEDHRHGLKKPTTRTLERPLKRPRKSSVLDSEDAKEFVPSPGDEDDEDGDEDENKDGSNGDNDESDGAIHDRLRRSPKDTTNSKSRRKSSTKGVGARVSSASAQQADKSKRPNRRSMPDDDDSDRDNSSDLTGGAHRRKTSSALLDEEDDDDLPARLRTKTMIGNSVLDDDNEDDDHQEEDHGRNRCNRNQLGGTKGSSTKRRTADTRSSSKGRTKEYYEAPKRKRGPAVVAPEERGHPRRDEYPSDDSFIVDEIEYDDDYDLSDEEPSSNLPFHASFETEERVGPVRLDDEQLFPIYIQFLISTLLDRDFVASLNQSPENKAYFMTALRKVEDDINFRKSSLVDSAAWTSEFRDILSKLPFIDAGDACQGLHPTCQACGRANHPANFVLHLSGIRYDTFRLGTKHNEWRLTHGKVWEERKFLVGRFCLVRSLVWHRMHHMKFHLMRQLFFHIEQLRSTKSGKRAVGLSWQHLTDVILGDEHYMRHLRVGYDRILKASESYIFFDGIGAGDSSWEKELGTYSEREDMEALSLPPFMLVVTHEESDSESEADHHLSPKKTTRGGKLRKHPLNVHQHDDLFDKDEEPVGGSTTNVVITRSEDDASNEELEPGVVLQRVSRHDRKSSDKDDEWPVGEEEPVSDQSDDVVQIVRQRGNPREEQKLTNVLKAAAIQKSKQATQNVEIDPMDEYDPEVVSSNNKKPGSSKATMSLQVKSRKRVLDDDDDDELGNETTDSASDVFIDSDSSEAKAPQSKKKRL
eukprot:ANDGO_02698.mRNA.1 hypothetical protein